MVHGKPAKQLCMCTPVAVSCLAQFLTHSWMQCCGTPIIPRLWNATLRGIQSLNCQRAPWHVLGPRSLALCWTFPGHTPWISMEQMTDVGPGKQSWQYSVYLASLTCCSVLLMGDAMLQSDGLSFSGSLAEVFLQFKLLSCGGWQEGGKW